MVTRGAAAGGLELRKDRIKARGHAGEVQLISEPCLKAVLPLGKPRENRV